MLTGLPSTHELFNILPQSFVASVVQVRPHFLTGSSASVYHHYSREWYMVEYIYPTVISPVVWCCVVVSFHLPASSSCSYFRAGHADSISSGVFICPHRWAWFRVNHGTLCPQQQVISVCVCVFVMSRSMQSVCSLQTHPSWVTVVTMGTQHWQDLRYHCFQGVSRTVVSNRHPHELDGKWCWHR